MGAAEEHLPRRRRKLKKWISDYTLGLIERKRLAFSRWQEHRVNKDRRRGYADLSKEVRRAVRGDKEKWLESTMQDMDEDMKDHRQGDFSRR